MISLIIIIITGGKQAQGLSTSLFHRWSEAPSRGGVCGQCLYQLLKSRKGERACACVPCVRACVRACVCACVNECVWGGGGGACVCACVRAVFASCVKYMCVKTQV